MFKLENQCDKLVCNYAENAIALAHAYSERKCTRVDGEITHKT